MKYIDLYSKDLSSKRWPENFYLNIFLLGSLAITFVYLLIVIGNLLGMQFLSSGNKKYMVEKQKLIVKEQEFNKMVSEMSRLRGDKKALTDILQTVEGLSSENLKWSVLLNDTSNLMNENVWIDSFSTNVIPGGILYADIHITGGGLTLESLNGFVKSLEGKYGDIKVSFKANKDEKLNFQYYSFSLTFLYKGTMK